MMLVKTALRRDSTNTVVTDCMKLNVLTVSAMLSSELIGPATVLGQYHEYEIREAQSMKELEPM